MPEKYFLLIMDQNPSDATVTHGREYILFPLFQLRRKKNIHKFLFCHLALELWRLKSIFNSVRRDECAVVYSKHGY